MAVLKRLSEHCEFGLALNDTICDRLGCGLRNEAIQKRLLTKANLKLEKAIEISTSMEMAAHEAQQLSASTQVHKFSIESKNKAAASKPCYRCGKTGHVAQECWCKDLDCRNCGKTGHIERACTNKKTQTHKQQRERKKNSFYRNKKKHVKIAQDEQRSSEPADEETVHVSVHDSACFSC